MSNGDGGLLTGLLTYAVVAVVVFLICREVVTWYWKVNAILTELRAIRKHLAGIEAATWTKPEPPTTVQPAREQG